MWQKENWEFWIYLTRSWKKFQLLLKVLGVFLVDIGDQLTGEDIISFTFWGNLRGVRVSGNDLVIGRPPIYYQPMLDFYLFYRRMYFMLFMIYVTSTLFSNRLYMTFSWQLQYVWYWLPAPRYQAHPHCWLKIWSLVFFVIRLMI